MSQLILQNSYVQTTKIERDANTRIKAIHGPLFLYIKYTEGAS